VPSDVLIVANPYEGERLRRALAAAGHRTATSDGGGETLAQLERASPRLVVLAPPLAHGDAEALLRRIRAQAGPALPVVRIGAEAVEAVGAEVALPRPLNMSALLSTVQDLLAAPPAPTRAAVGPPAEPSPPRPPEPPPAAAPPAAAAAEVERGRLAETDFATLLGRLYREGFTGRITLRDGEVEKSVLLNAGFPVSAGSTLAADRMNEQLLRAGRITRAQYEESKDMVDESGRKTGAILVDRGFLKESELLAEVRRHYEEILYSLFGWEGGEYEIVAGPPPEERVRIGAHPAAIVVEGLRRRGNAAQLGARLGGMLVALRPTGRADLLRDAGLTDREEAAAALIDGKRPLADVARRSGLAEADVCRLAWALLVLAVVRHPTAVVPVRELEWELLPDDTEIDRGRVAARHALVREGDYFEVLGVPRDATAVEVQRAHERARAHFDAAALPADVGARLRRELDEIALVLDEALRVLSDDERREAYRRAIE
jgi:uncharacterized protein DUF4388